MPILWRMRPFVCVLLTISIVVGTVAPAHACVCAAPASPLPKSQQQQAATPTRTVTSCCQPGAKKRSCCSMASPSTAKKSCCGDDARPADESERTSHPTALGESPACHCLRCDCESPTSPPTPAAPITAPGNTDLDEPATVSPIPVVMIAEPPTATARTARLLSASPPISLVISLSRLTC